MGFFTSFFKVAAALFGLLLFIIGVVGFFIGIISLFIGYSEGGGIFVGIIIIIFSILTLTISTYLNRFASDY